MLIIVGQAIPTDGSLSADPVKGRNHVGRATALTDLRQEEFVYAAVAALRAAMLIGPRAVEEYISRETLERRGLEQPIAQARAELIRAEHDLELAKILSPIDGIVLERHEQGDTVVPAGRPLLLIGNLGEIEAVVDVLTQDTMRLAPGTEVVLEPVGGMAEIPAHVKRIEPTGFTKLASLGVEPSTK